MHDPRSGRLHALDAVPVVGGRPVTALAPDPDHAGGIAVAFGGRDHPAGALVAFLRLEAPR